MTKSYVAYRLPNESKIHIYQGVSRLLSKIDDCKEQAFLLNSFNSDKKIAVEDLSPISRDQFEISFSSPAHINTDKNEYSKTFKTLKSAILAGEYKKVILSRTKKIETNKNSLAIFDALNSAYKNTFNYLISNSEIGTWIGATPEILVSIEGCTLKTMSLAGTKTPDKDWTSKEREEQELVTTSILEELTKNNCSQLSAIGPKNLNAGKIQHLKTAISGQLENINDWANIVRALHPTPAVCGIPKLKSLTYIQQLENHDREFYTGFVGIVNGPSKQLFVNLRCMQHYNGYSKLYLGGGITAPSVEEDEWQETEKKGTTLGSIL